MKIKNWTFPVVPFSTWWKLELVYDRIWKQFFASNSPHPGSSKLALFDIFGNFEAFNTVLI